MKLKTICLCAIMLALLLTGCNDEQEIHISAEDFIEVTCHEEKIADNYEITVVETDFAPLEMVDFYQTVGSRSYYLWHKDMDQKTMALKAEIGYYDRDTGERCTLLAYDRQEEFWMNELLAWEDCIVWAEYGIDEPGKIMKFDLAKEECTVLYETEENLTLSKWGEEVLFYGVEGIKAIDVETGKPRTVAPGDKLASNERLEWSGQVICYAEKQEDNLAIYYQNLKNKQSIILHIKDDGVPRLRIRANEYYISWQELAAPNDYSDSGICVYDIKENKCYRFNPEGSFLLYSLCSNGCLINLTGKEEKLVEFNVRENAIYTVYEKTEDKAYAGILPNGEDEWYIPFNSRLHGGKGEILIKSLPDSD